jgi:hypothetical protein
MGGARLPNRGPDDPGGFIDGSGVKACSTCGILAEYLCDFPMGKGKTCDAHLCEDHAIIQGRRPSNQLTLFTVNDPPNHDDKDVVHFCPAHELIARKGK